jgi:prepilin-type N-terminal cleavage/methylation domain-containing protein
MIMRRRGGFTILELMVAIAILGIFALIGGIAIQSSLGEARAKGAVRNFADLLMLARTEAIRTGDSHVVFFAQDAEGNALTGTSGQAAAALLIRDLDGDGRVDAGEKIASVNVDSTGSLSWGSVYAAVGSDQAPNDNPAADFPEDDADFLCCSFTEPDGDAARWVVFRPDGMPRAFSVGPFSAGNVASGNGAVYVTSGARDYAVVLAPLGGVRVHAWARGANAWTQ